MDVMPCRREEEASVSVATDVREREGTHANDGVDDRADGADDRHEATANGW